MLITTLTLLAFADPATATLEARAEPILLDIGWRPWAYAPVVYEAFARDLPRARHCYERARLRDPDLEGVLMTTFWVDQSGHVASAAVASATIADPGLHDCVLRFITGIRLPDYRADNLLVVNIPLRFRPAPVAP